MTDDLLHRIETFYDLVPRATARAEQLGPFTLFVADTGWPFYARPTLGARPDVTPADIITVLERQRTLGVPTAFEWLHDVSPDVLPAAEAAGLTVHDCPLMVLDTPAARQADQADPSGIDVRIVSADEPDLIRAARTAINMAFRSPGTDAGPDPDAKPATIDTVLARISEGLVVQAVALDTTTSEILGGGSHVPRPKADVTELAGIGVRPSARRRGVGQAIANALATDAKAAGIDTVFLSADSDAVARVYARAGFVRQGTSCIAEPA